MKETMKYEEAMNELERIVADMENEDADVDSLTKQLKRAQELIKFCRTRLTKTNTEIKRLLAEGKEQTQDH